jgi:hypothetical protein
MNGDRCPSFTYVVFEAYRVAWSVLALDDMSRTALAMVMVAASASVASAGGYIGLGIGTGPATSTDTSQMSVEADGRSGRLLLGARFGRLAAEGSIGRYGTVINQRVPFNWTSFGAGLKYGLPLGSGFEVLGRGGLQRTYVRHDDMADSISNSAGNGYYLGAGFEYRLNLGVTGASVFIDYQYAKTDLSSQALPKYEASNRMWTLGLTLAL